MYGNTGRVYLSESGIGKISAFFIALHGSQSVRTHSIGREEERASVTAGCDYHGVSGVTFDFSGDEVTGDDTACASVDDDEVEHFMTREKFHRAFFHLTAQCRVGAEQQLLSRLSFGIESTGYLGATERTVVEQTSVLTGERYALCYTLVDDGVGNFGQTVNVGFAGTVVSTFDRIVEETIHAVSVVLIVFGRIDTTLCCDGVCTAGRILYAETEYVESHFAE